MAGHLSELMLPDGMTIPVNMQKDHSVQAARYILTEYGQAKNVMKCPECGKEYASDAAHCAHDGSKLNPVERVLNRVLDASIAGAGMDP